MAGNGATTIEDLDRERLAALAAQSERDDAVLVEMVYRGRWVRFDITAMQASFLTLEQLVDRCFREPFHVLALPLAPIQGQSSSFTLDVKE